MKTPIRYEVLPPYMTPVDPKTGTQSAGNRRPIGTVCEWRNGEAAAYHIPLEFTGSEAEAQGVARLLNVPGSRAFVQAERLLESLKDRALTGDAARLALRLTLLVDEINGAAK